MKIAGSCKGKDLAKVINTLASIFERENDDFGYRDIWDTGYEAGWEAGYQQGYEDQRYPLSY